MPTSTSGSGETRTKAAEATSPSVVKRVRQKLDALVSPLHLEVVRGVGLRLVDRSLR